MVALTAGKVKRAKELGQAAFRLKNAVAVRRFLAAKAAAGAKFYKTKVGGPVTLALIIWPWGKKITGSLYVEALYMTCMSEVCAESCIATINPTPPFYCCPKGGDLVDEEDALRRYKL